MLRPNFKKYFQEDNFSESSCVLNDGDAEPFVDANPVWESRESNGDCEDGKKESRPKPKSVQQDVRSSGKSTKDPDWDSDRSVYELQLNQLQEQLVETMVENQQLGKDN